MQTAACLGPDLLLGQRQPQIRKGRGALAGFEAGGLAFGVVVALYADIVAVQLNELAQVASDRQALTGVDEAVDGDHALAAVCDRVDGESRAVAHVAAHEDIGLGGLPGHGVGLRGAVAVELDLGALQQLAPFCALTDGHQHVGAGDGDRLVLVIDGGEAMLGVIDAGTLFEYNPGHSPVFGQDLLRPPAVADDDSFLLDLRDLVLCRGHLVPLLQT